MELRVREWQLTSEWVVPSLVNQTKGTVRFLKDFIRLNERLVRKPFSLPTISTVLQELRGFTYATALDLNQVWAAKRLDWILTRPESVPSTFHGASTPISDYRWILQVLLIYSKRKCQS